MSPLPPGLRLVLDRSTRTYQSGRLIVGGRPRRVLRLTRAGRDALGALLDGNADSPGALRLGRRLLDGGVAHPLPEPSAAPPAVTVVVPARDRPAQLERCLAALGRELPVVVVDDGSRDAGAVAETARGHGARLIRRDRCGGPAAARNTGLQAVDTELVAFIDSDCVPTGDWLGSLAGHLVDPLVAGVAPRVLPAPTRKGRMLERFAAARSPLDMGPEPARAAPGGAVAYVPTAALLVRTGVPGLHFDERLRYGEDVDLIWRLHDAGWTVRYDPRSLVAHAEPAGWLRSLDRRRRYGTAAAALSRRHPQRVAHLPAGRGPSACALALLAGRPRAAAALLALLAARIASRTGASPPLLPLRTMAFAVAHAVVGIGRGATILAAPALLGALRFRRLRGAALILLLAPATWEWARRRPTLDPLSWALLCIADDAAYGLGVWQGCRRERTLAPIFGGGRSSGADARQGGRRAQR